jgi:hypothetical protein
MLGLHGRLCWHLLRLALYPAPCYQATSCHQLLLHGLLLLLLQDASTKLPCLVLDDRDRRRLWALAGAAAAGTVKLLDLL